MEGGGKIRLISLLKNLMKIRNDFLVYLVMVKNWVYKSSSGLILFQARKNYWHEKFYSVVRN